MDPFDSAVSLAASIRAREVSPVEVVELFLERIDRYDYGVNAFAWRDDEAVRGAARAAERALFADGPLGPFHGVPIPIKDLVDVAGQPNTMGGSLGVSDAPREESELVVERLLEAGFVLMGRSTSPEMGTMTVTENPRYGMTANPWDRSRSAAGSSGGAAVAVAVGMAPVAHASDGGGSIRMPSSACGLVGLKPSRARVPQRVQAWWDHCTTEGAIVRHVEDAAALLDAISAPDPLCWFQAPAPERPFAEEVGRDQPRLRVGLLTEAPTGLPVDPECAEAATVLGAALEQLGHDVFPVAPTFFSPAVGAAYLELVIPASLYAFPYDDPAAAEPYNRARWERVQRIHAGAHVEALALMQRETRTVVAQWGRDFDVLVTPTMACLPPPLGAVTQEANAHLEEPRLTEGRMVSFTAPCNIAGLPAVSLPVHRTGDGLPVGAQLIGAPFDEATLIRLASALEPRLGWTDAVPPQYR